MSEERVDKILLELYPTLTRSKLQKLIDKQKIFYKKNSDWICLKKASQKFPTEAKTKWEWRIEKDLETQFVSRGALKLLSALENFNIDVKGQYCLDIGLSTGGFSDCLLQHGAKKILGIDVGTELLHHSLKDRKELIWLDKINARQPLEESLLEDFFSQTGRDKFDLIVIDVSFISLDKIIPNLPAYLHSSGKIIALVKPQFELDKKALNKKGVVKDSERLPEVLQKIGRVFAENKLKVIQECLSAIEGENGNKEFLLLAQHC